MLKNSADLSPGANMDDVHQMTLDGTLEHFGLGDLEIPAWSDAK